MLQQLSIKNFALIDSLHVNFHDGFSIITGETGAGKSIILGALGLILGKRAELSLLKEPEKKCIIEGEFAIEKYDLEPYFEQNDLDYEALTIIRREIAPNGKSRAFINDSPVTLNILNEISKKLIDIHSQHETLQLADKKFQFQIIDALANNAHYLNDYKEKLVLYNRLNVEMEHLISQQREAKLQYDYNIFLVEELKEAQLKAGEQEELEKTLDKLNNAEAIKQNFVEAINVANSDDVGLKSLLSNFKNNLSALASYSKDYQDLLDRCISLDIEFKDIVDDLERSNEDVSVSPQEIINYNSRLQLFYDLQKKHGVNSIKELIEIENELQLKVDSVDNASGVLEEKKESIQNIANELHKLALKISDRRAAIIPDLVNKLEVILEELAMPNTRFKVEMNTSDIFLNNGKDELQFLLSTNKGSNFENLKKVASGGEMSRIMLAIKALLSEHDSLPTILFDEIDAGVSGEVSRKMAYIMKEMSAHMQVISITHLPQVAAKGQYHYKVYKQDNEQQTITNIKQLTEQERINELAEMLSGKELVSSAIEHAKQLLN